MIFLTQKIVQMYIKSLYLTAILSFLSMSSIAQKGNFQLESWQLSIGGVLSSKIPSAANTNYWGILGIMGGDTSNTQFNPPYSRSNLGLKPIFHGYFDFKIGQNSLTHRLGISYQNRLISSFAMTGELKSNAPDTAEYVSKYRIEHTSPVLQLDYSILKQIQFNDKIQFNLGFGAYMGLGLGNHIRTNIKILNSPYGNIEAGYFSDVFQRHFSFLSLDKYKPNLGVFTSLGFQYCLNSPTSNKQKWYFTYESRFCFDYFVVKSVPSSWFSFQCSQQLGIKYYLNR